MEKIKSYSNVIPQSVVFEERMIDVNEDVVEETTSFFDEEGNEVTQTQYSYTTYRFRDRAEYTKWLDEKSNARIDKSEERIAENNTEIVVLNDTIFEILTEVIPSMMTAE